MTPADQHLERMAASLQAWERALGSAAAGGAVLEVGRLVGSIVPAAATRSIVNTVSGPFGTSLSTSDVDEVAARYESAGIVRWGAWVHEQDRLSVAVLEQAG